MFTIDNDIWKVEFVDSDNINLIRDDNTYSLGVTDLHSKTVYISNKIKGKLLEKVLLHEICHCYIFTTGYYFDLQTEEVVCDFVANFGIDIIDTLNYVLKILPGKVNYF